MQPIDLLEYQVYTLAQVDRMLGLPPGTARRWIDGYRRNGRFYEPIVRLTSTGDNIVTWGEFVETRLLSEYRSTGIRLFRLRSAVEALRSEFGQYPLAHAQLFLRSDGRDLLRQVQDEVGLDEELQLVRVIDGQAQLTMPAREFTEAAHFDEQSDVVTRIAADRERYPDVTIDPVRAYGEPSVRAVPTEIIAEHARAGDDEAHIAALFELDPNQVRAAIAYEERHAA